MANEEPGCKKKVMIAIDESECSHYALKWVLDHLQDFFPTSSLIIFTVQSLADFAYLSAASPVSGRMFCVATSYDPPVSFFCARGISVLVSEVNRLSFFSCFPFLFPFRDHDLFFVYDL
uniref:Universal stress protein A-like protein n=1 Tax=Nelumbo nucifera TaxID=4432 RepID=A0A822YRU7_NELNU|nr:TPA_asm: hypothetical protein HUJ06_006012 [Nelumbo nucifera]